MESVERDGPSRPSYFLSMRSVKMARKRGLIRFSIAEPLVSLDDCCVSAPVHFHDQNILERKAAFFDMGIEFFHCHPAILEGGGDDAPIADDDAREAIVGKRYVQVLRRGNAFFRLEQHAERTVGFSNRILDILDAEHIFLPQCLHQVVYGKAQSLELCLVNNPIADDDEGMPLHEATEFWEFHIYDRGDHFKGDQQQNRDDRIDQGRPVILHGNGGDFRNEDGDDKLGRLQLSDLSLAHNTYGKDD